MSLFSFSAALAEDGFGKEYKKPGFGKKGRKEDLYLWFPEEEKKYIREMDGGGRRKEIPVD